jgi:hypothetical protein
MIYPEYTDDASKPRRARKIFLSAAPLRETDTQRLPGNL